MIRVSVVDTGAQSRLRIAERLNILLSSEASDLHYLPAVSVRALSLEELPFFAAPDVLVLGPELVASDTDFMNAMGKLAESTAILAWLDPEQDKLELIERLARRGVQDTIDENTASSQIVRKLILLVRGLKKRRSAKLLLVDAARGGLGVSSIAAALGETAIDAEKRVLLIDFDVDSQALSRYLQVRPLLNDNLQAILEKKQPLTEESVAQAITKVWSDDERLFCLTPPVQGDLLFSRDSSYARTFLSLLELLDGRFDLIICDLARTRAPFLNTMYRIADASLFLLNCDPAALYASVEKFLRCKSYLSPQARARFLLNDSGRWSGLSSALLRREVVSASGLEADVVLSQGISHLQAASRWPGSGATLSSLGGQSTVKALQATLVDLFPEIEFQARSYAWRFPWKKIEKEIQEPETQEKQQEISHGESIDIQQLARLPESIKAA